MNKEPTKRNSPIEMSAQEFREAGHEIIDHLADFIENISQRPISPGKDPDTIRNILGVRNIPVEGKSAESILQDTTELLIENSTFNSHPRFWGYITSSAAPIGVLGDLLASMMNPNVGGWQLSPMASEIEIQTIKWIAEMVRYPTDGGGILVSGGNMANFLGFLAARENKAKYPIRKEGMVATANNQMTVYVSKETHTWIQKAADFFGHGTNTIRWIETDDKLRMIPEKLIEQLEEDLKGGFHPFMVVGTAGSVSTGAIDPLYEIADICSKYDLWFHVDGAYGGFAAVLPDAPNDLKAFKFADSIALDPHKWLYSPIEAGCILVKDKAHLTKAFSYIPSYYHFEGSESSPPTNFYEYGMQNTRGFRALKVWLGLQHAGKNGYINMIREDIELAAYMAEVIKPHKELEQFTNSLSITTFRYVPAKYADNKDQHQEDLNSINTTLLENLQKEGNVYLSNAVVDGNFLLRACIVNFRTTKADVEALPEIVLEAGRKISI